MNDPKGHRATSPWKMPKAAWKDILKRTYTRIWDDNIGIVAAGVAFYGFFALLSLLGLIVLIYGVFTDRSAVIEHVHVLTAVLPSDVAMIIGDQLLTSVQASEGVKGLGILIAFLIAVYGGTNGAAAILTALNIAYEEKEKRSLVRYYLVAITMTLSAVVLALCAISATAAVAFLQDILPKATTGALIAGKIVGYVALVLVAAAVAATLYRFGPAREKAQWSWITPGSLFAALTWMVLTSVFGTYVAQANFDKSYGSLGAVVALMTWLYLSAYAFLFGAELNSEIEHQTAHDSTTGEAEPLGERGAWAADNVAYGADVQDRPEEAREGARLTAASPTVADAAERKA